jgi:hypothetical protein
MEDFMDDTIVEGKLNLQTELSFISPQEKRRGNLGGRLLQTLSLFIIIFTVKPQAFVLRLLNKTSLLTQEDLVNLIHAFEVLYTSVESALSLTQSLLVYDNHMRFFF